ncbi:MAG: fibronectin type III domain-containing protein [Ruminiclostridium sp.]|nr:fibronectin type III domain-containing protein [Ruminiclostridium sp.]
MKKTISMLLTIFIAFSNFTISAFAETAKLSAPTSITATAKSTTAITLKWNSVKSASKYYVYFSTKKSGSYSKYGATDKTSLNIKNLKENTTYYFCVIAKGIINGKTISSEKSDILKCKTKTSTQNTSGIEIISKPGLVHNNDYATLKIKGEPNTEYVCAVQYSTKWSEAKGLGVAKSDNSGNVIWTWKVGANTKEGNHPIRITKGGKIVYSSDEIFSTAK